MKKWGEGKCFGRWDAGDKACSKCLGWVRTKCEETTKRKSAALSESEPSEFSRNEWNNVFLRLLEARYERRVEWGEPFVQNVFFKEGKKHIFAAYSLETGRMKVKTRAMEKCVTLSSEAEAEALLKEIDG